MQLLPKLPAEVRFLKFI